MRRNVGNRGFRIQAIEIKNYKGIDTLCFEFPQPTLAHEPDVCVFGSQNGLGKTSFLECCAILVMAFKGQLITEDTLLKSAYNGRMNPVRGGQKEAVIKGTIFENGARHTVKVTIDARGGVDISPTVEVPREKHGRHFLYEVMGVSPNPIVSDGLVFMHSYRKTTEYNPDFGGIIRDGMAREGRDGVDTYRPGEAASTFKIQVFKNLMAHAGLFGEKNQGANQDAIDQLNKLLRTYANVSLSKIRPYEDNTIDLMVEQDGTDFPLNGLSSGQKEIVSTLFLTWVYTKDEPHVILIDEPELHLNSLWHKSFVRNLMEIAPSNQYIIATHSEQIMRSVDQGFRFILG